MQELVVYKDAVHLETVDMPINEYTYKKCTTSLVLLFFVCLSLRVDGLYIVD